LANDLDQQTDISGKVAKAGDTMTGRLIVGTSGTNQNGIESTGNGTGAGISTVGGATGNGGRFEGGGGNANGAFCVGKGTGAGVSATGGATGPGVSATGGAAGVGLTAANGVSQTATAPTCAIQSAGYLQMTGASPNPNVDPGANNALHGSNIPKAWCTIDTSYTVLDGHNIASVTNVAGSIYKVTFARPMANANYGVSIQQHGAPGGSGSLNSNKNAGDFEFVLYKTNDLSLGFVASTTHAYIEVMGRQ
jgi:hypothetical protein